LPSSKNVLKAIRHIVLGIIDFFHKPFEKVIGKQTFRYLACGGSNTVSDILIYYFSYHYIVLEQYKDGAGSVLANYFSFKGDLPELPVSVAGIEIAPHIFAFLISFSISFPIGFALSKYIVFPESNLRGRVQLFRYAVLVGMCIVLNYVFLKLFVEVCNIYPTPSKILTTALVAVFSYISQRRFTFKVKPITVEPEPVALKSES
jgi:putative flippase GtrA